MNNDFLKLHTDDEEENETINKFDKFLQSVLNDDKIDSETMDMFKSEIEDMKRAYDNGEIEGYDSFEDFMNDTINEIAKEINEEDETDATGKFGAFVLLSENTFDKEKLIKDLANDWDIVDESTDDENDDFDEINHKNDLIISYEGNTIIVSLFSTPIPDNEAVFCAESNFLWPDAVKQAKKHKAFLTVALMGEEEDLVEKGVLFTEVVMSCCKQKNVLGVYTNATVYEPDFYMQGEEFIDDGELPIYNMVWLGLYKEENGISGYTCGMDVYGKDEMEIINSEAEPFEILGFLTDVVSYVLEEDVTLYDGETIGTEENEKIPITRSEGVNVRGMSLKFGFMTEE